MPSPKKTRRPPQHPPAHNPTIVFFPIVTLAFIMWFAYRSMFSFPIWFDESVGKALFFGFPVWLYIMMTKGREILETFSIVKFETGLLKGLAFGGLYGFSTSIFVLLATGQTIQLAPLFMSNQFWSEFMLALMTGFWETLLFFSFIMTVLLNKFPRWSIFQVAGATTAIFLVFHAPNMVLRADVMALGAQLLLLSLFALGQSLIFYSHRNSYALILSHAFWGMVLMTHGIS